MPWRISHYSWWSFRRTTWQQALTGPTYCPPSPTCQTSLSSPKFLAQDTVNNVMVMVTCKEDSEKMGWRCLLGRRVEQEESKEGCRRYTLSDWGSWTYIFCSLQCLSSQTTTQAAVKLPVLPTAVSSYYCQGTSVPPASGPSQLHVMIPPPFCPALP